MSILFATATMTFVRGTTWLQDLTLTESETGLPVDLAGCALTLRVRESYEHPTIIMEMSTVNGRLTIGNPALGEVSLRVEAADTLDFPTADYVRVKYVYDAIIDRTGPPAQREAGVKGQIAVLPQVTRLDEV